jgi:hypothetical protein
MLHDDLERGVAAGPAEDVASSSRIGNERWRIAGAPQ